MNVASTTHELETPLIYQIPPPTLQKPPIYQRPSTRRRRHQFAKPRNNFEKNPFKQYTPLAEPIDQLYERLRVAGYIAPIP